MPTAIARKSVITEGKLVVAVTASIARPANQAMIPKTMSVNDNLSIYIRYDCPYRFFYTRCEYVMNNQVYQQCFNSTQFHFSQSRPNLNSKAQPLVVRDRELL